MFETLGSVAGFVSLALGVVLSLRALGVFERPELRAYVVLPRTD